MIVVRVIAGDESGGPHAEVSYDMDRSVESLTDNEINELRAGVAKTYDHWFGGPPDVVIVTVTEQADEEASG